MGPLGPGALMAETALLIPADWRSRLLERSVVIWRSDVITRNQYSSAVLHNLHYTAALRAATNLLLRHSAVVHMRGQGTQWILGENDNEDINVFTMFMTCFRPFCIQSQTVSHLKQHVALDSPLDSSSRSFADSEMVSNLPVAVSGPEPAHDVGKTLKFCNSAKFRWGCKSLVM